LKQKFKEAIAIIIDTEKIEKLLADKTVSAYEIESKSGVNRTVLAKLRRGEAELDNMTLKNVKKLMEYVKMEESKMEITKYELRVATAEVKKDKLHEGVTQEQNDIMSEIVKEFDNLEDAKAALENYETKVEYLGRGKYYVTEYYVEVNDYEVIDGEEYIESVGEVIFAKGNYNI
jgi:transcriptional regulator with XRE-family HTH domain